jgi:outer membrane murein-binding lipoprotein Lpp
MSVKEVDEIRQKVFYIDRYVTPFLNNQIMQINSNISQLINKVEELDKKVNSLTQDSVSNENETNNTSSNTINSDNKDKIPKRSSNNDIRTISLQ